MAAGPAGVDYYDSETLIVAVEKRPALYDKKDDNYNDKMVRDRLWKEVCEAIIPTWFDLSERGKQRAGRDVQRKWKNIRDCFRKEINQQKKWKAAGGKRKRRKYIFYDQLLFLLPTMQERDKKFNFDDNSLSSVDDVEENVDGTNSASELPDKRTSKLRPWKYFGRKYRVPNDALQVPAAQDNEVEEIDEDKYFLLSLLPSFKSLPPSEKFTAKIEFLQTLRSLACPTAPDIHVTSNNEDKQQPRTSFDIHTEVITKRENEDF